MQSEAETSGRKCVHSEKAIGGTAANGRNAQRQGSVLSSTWMGGLPSVFEVSVELLRRLKSRMSFHG